VPRRLSYPEIIPAEVHPDCLYRDRSDLVAKLCRLLDGGDGLEATRRVLSEAMGRYAWETVVGGFDGELEEMVGGAARQVEGRR
jgi:hypothetical protein